MGEKMTLHDRVEFALRDAGFDLDEASRIATLADPHITQPAQSVDDAALLDFIGRECLTVRCESTDDDDVEWDVVSYHMDAPKERVIGTGATPREALTAALQEKGNG